MRLNQFDILKAIGIILVIVGHTLDYNIMRNMIYSFHMPLFFLVSGYFLKVKNPVPPIKKLGKRLLIPYLLSSIIIALSANIIFYTNKHSFDVHYIINWLQSIAYGNGVTEGTQFHSIGPLWFLPALFWGTIILSLLIQAAKYVSPVLTTLLCVIIALFLSQHKICLPLSILQGMLGVGYMYIGYLMRIYYPTIILKDRLSWIIITVIWMFSFKSGYLSLVQCYANPELLALTGALCGTYLVYVISNHIAQRKDKMCRAFTELGKMTLLILCIHSIEDSIIPWKTYINNIALHHYVSNCIIIFVRVLVVISISVVLLKFKFIQKIFKV